MTLPNALKLPQRTEKPRNTGLTAINDVGVPVGEQRLILEDYHSLVDLAKIGVGSAYVLPRLEEKVALYHEHGIPACFGGTLFEKFHHQGKLDDYLDYLRHYGVQWVEVSCGTIDISVDEMVRAIERLEQAGFQVVTEVGKKSEEETPDIREWIAEAEAFLAAGSRYVILEGRASGTVGLYHETGELRHELFDEIVERLPVERLIFEAPTEHCQIQMINLLGCNVNLGNVDPRGLVMLETQRRYLRSDTFFNPLGL
ncbi:phosphosulfolactate synthase [Endothiovibrio diazotrophicus]